MYYYRIYGRKIESDIEFMQLVPDETMQEADIYIYRRNTDEDIVELMKESYTLVGAGESWFHNKTLRCVVRDGKYIYYEPYQDINEQYLRTYILGYGLSMLFLQQNKLAIHGSCIRRDEQAFIISGVSGAGKSTLTSQFLSAGYEFMADDITLVDGEGSPVMAYPCFPYQKLCRDVVDRRNLNTDDLIYIDEDKDKYLVKWEGKYSTQGAAVATLIVILVGDEECQVTIEEADGFEKLQYIVDNLFLRRAILFKENNPQVIKLCLDVASKIRILVVTRPYEQNTAQMQLELIEQKLKQFNMKEEKIC